eukprot:TRINITY_DN40613_c0_g1_i1.p1 TRINITY_DN40613_c0_g1~~TRINITY_DN40613_c0_g1_i1.p1  ORF type:complete len:194 (+),score=40.69 TRINITY_DN40613_c0_g1_i1:54-635(+)
MAAAGSFGGPGPSTIGSASAQAGSDGSSEVERLTASVTPLVKNFNSMLRSWRSFASFSRPPTVPKELAERMFTNVHHFQANYVLVVFVIVMLHLLGHPSRLVMVAIAALGWAVYVQKGGLDPDWKMQVGGTELGSQQRLMLLSAICFVFFFVLAGDFFVTLTGLSALFVAVHAALHPGPDAVGDFHDIDEESL